MRVYTDGIDDTFAIMTLYVDGIFVTGSNEQVVKGLKKPLMDCFAMANMGEVSLIFGTAVTRHYDAGTLTDHHSK